MYEQFGAREVGDTGKVRFRLFLPDSAEDPSQYEGVADPKIASVRVGGDFQAQLNPPGVDWDFAGGPLLAKNKLPGKGWVYEWESPPLAEGFYQYKYFVTFQDGQTRKVGDPCTKYGGATDDNSGVAVGGHKTNVNALANPKPLRDLVLYELMIDDFTARYRNARSPFDALRDADKLDHLQAVGVNAVEFMPWVAWPGGGFSWGYNPFQYFAAAHTYTLDPANNADKLYYLKRLINELHARGVHVILDMVLNHADVSGPDKGFAYFWLYQDPADCPYVGNFAGTFGGFVDLNFSNGCTHQFILDACKYWVDVFKLDGIRLDYTLGFYKPHDKLHGLHRLVSDLKAHLAAGGVQNFALILEHLSEPRYTAIDVVNNVGATSCWYQRMLELAVQYTYGGPDAEVMRLLNANKDFAAGVPVTYIESHDHTTLAWHAGNAGGWWKTQPLAVALFTCPGAPMLHNGQEFGDEYWFPEPPGGGRVQPRPLNWDRAAGGHGAHLKWLYGKLAAIRHAHPGLRSPNFHPAHWEGWMTQPDPQHYGVDVQNGTVVFHRWGDDGQGGVERFIIVLNFSGQQRGVHVPFPLNGEWEDLLSGWKIDVGNFHWYVHVGANWGHVFWKKG